MRAREGLRGLIMLLRMGKWDSIVLTELKEMGQHPTERGSMRGLAILRSELYPQ